MRTIKSMPKHMRPREKLIERGAGNLNDKELLAILIGTGMPGKNVLNLAGEILDKFPQGRLLHLNYNELSRINGVGPGKACSLLASFELAKRVLKVGDDNMPTIDTMRDAVAQLQELRIAKKEHFVALYLNARNQLICKETISIGTLDESLVHPREVFKPAVDCLAATMVVTHNHPSGDLEPSLSDIEMTKKLVHAGKILDIAVKDHIIVTNNGQVSILKMINQ